MYQSGKNNIVKGKWKKFVHMAGSYTVHTSAN